MRLARAVAQLAGRRILREAGWVALGQLAQGGARLAGIRVLTELLSPGVYGEVVLLLGVATLGNNLFCMPLLAASLRFYPDAAAAGRASALRGLLVRIVVKRTLALLGAVGLAGALWALLGGGGVSSAGFLAVLVILALDAARLFETTLQNAARRQMAFSLWGAADACARPLLAIALVLLLGPHTAVVLAGYAAALGLVNAAFRRTAVRGEAGAPAPAPGWTETTQRELLAYAAPLAPLALLDWFSTLGDRYLLAGWAGTHEAGIYAAGYGLGSMPFIVLGQMLMLIVRPVFFEAVARQDRRRERLALVRWLALLGALLAAGLFALVLLREPIARLLLGEDFWGASAVIPWIGAAYALQSLRNVFDAVLHAERRTRRLLASNAVGAASSAALYALLIPALGARGAAMGTAAGMLASCAASLALSGALPRLLGRGERGS